MKKYPHLFFLLPALILVFGLSIYPMIYSIYTSLINLTIVTGTEVDFVGIANFLRAFEDNEFIGSVYSSISYSALCLAIEIPLGLALGLAINSIKRGQKTLRFALIMPMITTPVVSGLIFRTAFLPDMGIVNYILRLINIKPLPWLATRRLAFISVTVADVWQWTPFVTLIVVAALQGIPPELFNAAKVDGASSFLIFRSITLPLIKPALIIAVLLRLMDTLKIFDHIFIMTRGGPTLATNFLSVFIFKNAFKFFHISYACAISWIYLMVFSVVILIFFKRFKVKV